MECVGEIKSLAVPLNGATNRRGVFDHRPHHPAQLVQPVDDRFAIQLVGVAQYPLAFEQNGLGQEDVAAGKKVACLASLHRVVTHEETHDDVGIDGVHVARLAALTMASSIS